MLSSAPEVRVFRFGLYELDLAARELRRNGSRLKLQDRPFDVLSILLEHAGEVVSRELFRQRLWPADTFVDVDASLNTSITKLRQALSDDANNPRFIATAGRRGYRFIAPALRIDGAEPRQAPEPTPPSPESKAGTPAAQIVQRRAMPRRWLAGVAVVAAALLSLVVLAFLSFPKPKPKVLNIVKISHDGRLDPWGRLTSDGARYFYLAREGGHWNLMQVPAAGGDSRPFPEPARNVRFADISPDRSEFLSFAFSSRGGDLPLSLTPVTGGPPSRVGTIVADDATFAPDGKRIVFTRPDGVYSCDRDGTGVQKIVALHGRSQDPRWAPDGLRLRLTLQDAGSEGREIWEVYRDGSKLHRIIADSGFSDLCCGRWSAYGRYFFFEAVREGARNVWAIREQPGSWLSPPAKPVQLTFGPLSYGVPTPGQDASQLFVYGGNEQFEAVRYDPVFRRVEPLLPGFRSGPVVPSPDGFWLAFLSGEGLLRSHADGSARQMLVSGFKRLSDVQWSPDGQRILFHGRRGASPAKWFILPSDGGALAELPVGAGETEAAWHADGQAVVFARWADSTLPLKESGIYTLDLSTSKITKIPGSEGLIHPRVSPNGQYLASVTERELSPGQPCRLKLFAFRTQTWSEAAQGTLLNPGPWSSDSKYVYYQDILGSNEPVFRIGRGAAKPELSFDFGELLRAGYTRCAFAGFDAKGTPLAALTRSEVDLYRLDLELP
jgi:DNA-binding winged helix-turn-helix (wHTH) protein/Tol biopolymer transport system component